MATKVVTVGDDMRPPGGGYAGSDYRVRPVGRSVTTLDDSDTGYEVGTDEDVLIVDTQSGVCTIVLPPAADCPGKEIVVIRAGTGVNAITVDGNGAELVDGGATYTALDAQGDKATLLCDGTEWILLHTNIAP